LGELQEQTEEIVKRSQVFNPKLTALDERMARIEQRIDRLSGLGEDVKVEFRDFAEQMRLAEQERAQQVAGWGQELEGYSAEVKRYGQRWEGFMEHLAEAQQVLGELTDLEERQVREQQLVAERQRVAEEAMRKEQQKWQGESSSIWMRHDLEWRNHLEEWEAVNQQFRERFGQVEDWRREEMELLLELRELIVQEREERKEWLMALWEVQKELAERSVGDTQKWAEQLRERADRWLKDKGE
jgi:hypothetical protein